MGFSSDNPLLLNQLPLSIDFPTDPVDLQMIQSTAYKKTVDAINTKEGGLYLEQELGSFIQYFPTSPSPTSSQSLILRPGYRMTVDMGPIPSGATVSQAHGIDVATVTAVTRMYGGALSVGPFLLPIPYASSTPNLNIELFADATNVTVKNGAGQNNLTQCYVVIEYLKTP